MKKWLGILLISFTHHTVFAQAGTKDSADPSWQTEYRATAPRVNDLVHTKLELRFDYAKAYAYGKAWITLKPHFYPTDSLVLDAKGMDIAAAGLFRNKTVQPLPYSYDGKYLTLHLDRNYTKSETYTVYVDYTAKPNEYKEAKGSAAITSAKGLYFINPDGSEKGVPTQIWTQGETEGTSVWCPTIDRPNQKSTQEFLLTVPDKYVTLSNGLLIAKKQNPDGTRTDTWKMELPNAPYLFFAGVGDYAVVKDQYKGKEVSYYVEREYAPVARKIFGYTPEMMAYFSRLTGVEYPWPKYAQITGQQYVSGAMENTTSTLHSSAAQQDARELVDGNAWEGVVAHELFHHWFGDYVTAESWSNLTLNESFANYSEVLWEEYKHGKDAADAHNYSDQTGYLMSGSEQKQLVRFYYADKEDLFDAVSYNKGGRILHMLRNLTGDSAFFKALNLYLTTHKFKSAEAHQLRLAFEEVTGLDLNWFFNQWYYGSGHPFLSINYLYQDEKKEARVIIKQTQDGERTFRLPIAVDVYQGASKKRYTVWSEHRSDTFYFPYATRPELINVDAEKILLLEKSDNKNLEEYLHQYQYAGHYVDRREAIEYALKRQEDPKAFELLKKALSDPYKGLRQLTLEGLDMKEESIRKAVEPLIQQIAQNEKAPLVTASAISLLGSYRKNEYRPLFEQKINDSSYSVSGAALEALQLLDPEAASRAVQKIKGQPLKGRLLSSSLAIMMGSGEESFFDEIVGAYGKMPLSQEKFDLTLKLCDLISKTNDLGKVKNGIDKITAFREGIPEQFGIRPVINNFLKGIISKKESAKKIAIDKGPLQEQIDYIRKKIEE